jgi:GH25 family lysozyme M1 (1,4-beta-N-acetylmuramidase)
MQKIREWLRWLLSLRFGDKAGAGTPPDNTLTRREIFALGLESLISYANDLLITDTSKWDAAIDYIKMLFAGAGGTILKCGQGSALDPWFKANWALAKFANIKRGTYWFYDSRVDPWKQAKLWADAIASDTGELPHFADYEEKYGGMYAGINNFTIFLQEFQRLSGLPVERIGIYTGYYYWVEHGGTDSFFRRFWLWLAWYGSAGQVIIPKPWTIFELLLWQFTDHADGRAFGVSANELDLSYFVKGREVYKSMFGDIPDTEPQIGENMIYALKVTTTTLNGRTEPGGVINFANGFRVGDALTADMESKTAVETWYRITGCLRLATPVSLPNPVWACLKNGTGTYMTLLSATETVPTKPNPSATVNLKESDGKEFTGTVELKPK